MAEFPFLSKGKSIMHLSEARPDSQTIVELLPRELLRHISFLSPDVKTFASLILTHREFSGHGSKLIRELKMRFTTTTLKEIVPPFQPNPFQIRITKKIGNRTQIDDFVLDRKLLCMALKSREILITAKLVTDPKTVAVFGLVKHYSPPSRTRAKSRCRMAYTKINGVTALTVKKQGWKLEYNWWTFEWGVLRPLTVRKQSLSGELFDAHEFFGPEGKRRLARHFEDEDEPEPEFLKMPDWEKVTFGLPALLSVV